MTRMQSDTVGMEYQSKAKPALPRHGLTMLAMALLTLLILFPTARGLAVLSLNDQRYSHLWFAPLFCILLIHWRRQEIFVHAQYTPRIGIFVLAPSLLAGVAAGAFAASSNEPASLIPGALSMIGAWTGAFILCFGIRSFAAAIYPLGCLLLAVPVPNTWMDQIIAFFQQGSAVVTYSMLETLGVSVFRQEMNFSIPGLNFNIAPECSGIHSGTFFLIIGILSGHLFLRKGWFRLILILATIPIAIFKNAVRIVVITLLASYVNRAFIDGPFHHQYSGIIFAPLDFVLFVPLLFALYRFERRSPHEVAITAKTLEVRAESGVEPVRSQNPKSLPTQR